MLATPTCGIARKVIGAGPGRGRPGEVTTDPPLVVHLVDQRSGHPSAWRPLLVDSGATPSLQLIGPAWSEMLLLVDAGSLEEAGIAGFRSPHDR